jgi:tRNA(Ile)-lysidine synthase
LGTRARKASPPKRAELHPFEAAVLETVRRRRLLGPADSTVAALSGGPDSTALVAALSALHRAGEAGPVIACHVDHGLRPGSERDAAHCRGLCARLGLRFAARSVRVRPGNVQAQARRARYAALRAAAAEAGAAHIATGHTRADQAETVVLRLLRGAGARGLAGIPPRRGALVRPLIDRSREEVLAYLAARGLPALEDPSNATGRFLRNRVRAEVMPALRRLAPAAERALARAADLLRGDDRALERSARALHRGKRAEVEALLAAAAAVRRRVVRRLWKAATGSRRGLTAEHVASVLRLLRRPRPGRISLPGGVEARVAGGRLEMAGGRDGNDCAPARALL